MKMLRFVWLIDWEKLWVFWFEWADTKTYSVGGAWTVQGFEASHQESHQLYHCRVCRQGMTLHFSSCLWIFLSINLCVSQFLSLFTEGLESQQRHESRAKLWRSWIELRGRSSIQLRRSPTTQVKNQTRVEPTETKPFCSVSNAQVS